MFLTYSSPPLGMENKWKKQPTEIENTPLFSLVQHLNILIDTERERMGVVVVGIKKKRKKGDEDLQREWWTETVYKSCHLPNIYNKLTIRKTPSAPNIFFNGYSYKQLSHNKLINAFDVFSVYLIMWKFSSPTVKLKRTWLLLSHN